MKLTKPGGGGHRHVVLEGRGRLGGREAASAFTICLFRRVALRFHLPPPLLFASHSLHSLRLYLHARASFSTAAPSLPFQAVTCGWNTRKPAVVPASRLLLAWRNAGGWRRCRIPGIWGACWTGNMVTRQRSRRAGRGAQVLWHRNRGWRADCLPSGEPSPAATFAVRVTLQRSLTHAAGAPRRLLCILTGSLFGWCCSMLAATDL